MPNPESLLILFREDLRMGKYTKEFAALRPEQVEAMMWLVGEMGCRHESHPRARVARVALQNFSRAPLTVTDVRALMRAAMRL